MSLVKYHYNPKTCRYEPAQFSIWKASLYIILFITVTGLLTSGMLILHSRLFETDKMKALRIENNALLRYHAQVDERVNTIDATLASLSVKEKTLNEKLFGKTDKQEASAEPVYKENILLADASGFQNIVTHMKDRSDALKDQGNTMNSVFSGISYSDKELGLLMRLPSIVPIKENSSLASGFGNRINPFHKGNYHHPGADFVAPHGAHVVATGDGRVVSTVKNSSIQAGYGNYIEVDHGNGIITRYAHLEEIRVKNGQRVTKGFVIGTVGMSGGTIAPHVHYEIIRKGLNVDPVPYMMGGLSEKEYDALLIAGEQQNQSLD